MKMKQYECVLKWLYGWEREAGEYAISRDTLRDKVEAQRFRRHLEDARRLLRDGLFNAEDLAKWCKTRTPPTECDTCGQEVGRLWK